MKTNSSQSTKMSEAWRRFDHFDIEWFRIQELKKQKDKTRSTRK